MRNGRGWLSGNPSVVLFKIRILVKCKAGAGIMKGVSTTKLCGVQCNGVFLQFSLFRNNRCQPCVDCINTGTLITMMKADIGSDRNHLRYYFDRFKTTNPAMIYCHRSCFLSKHFYIAYRGNRAHVTSKFFNYFLAETSMSLQMYKACMQLNQ